MSALFGGTLFYTQVLIGVTDAFWKHCVCYLWIGLIMPFSGIRIFLMLVFSFDCGETTAGVPVRTYARMVGRSVGRSDRPTITWQPTFFSSIGLTNFLRYGASLVRADLRYEKGLVWGPHASIWQGRTVLLEKRAASRLPSDGIWNHLILPDDSTFFEFKIYDSKYHCENEKLRRI